MLPVQRCIPVPTRYRTSTGTIQLNRASNNGAQDLYVNIAYCIYSILYSKHVDATTI